MNSEGTVLLVEDNERVQLNNREILKRQGYNIILAMNLAEARAAISSHMPDVIVLDIMLPDGNGLNFLEELRKTSQIPVLVLTSDQTPEKSSESLDTGSDDFLRKPYSLKELRARVDALMRRAAHVPEMVRKGPFALDITKMMAFLNGKDLAFPQKEFSLLMFFIQHEGEIMSEEYLYEKIWGQPMIGDSQAIRKSISRLRVKITGSGYYIYTLRGQGYCFRLEQESEEQ